MSYAPGIYPGVTNADYHADSALGSTSLKTLATRTPAHWKWEREHPVHKDAYDLGTVTHSLILEGDESGVDVIDVADKRGLKWSVPAADAEDAGKIPLTSKEWAHVKGMRDSVMVHSVAKHFFTGHKAEHSVFWEEGGLILKCRPDAWNPGVIVDLKTTVDADPNAFGKTAFNFGYFMSAAHYIDGVKAATGEDVKFRFVNVEKTAPYLVSVTELDDVALDYGRQMLVRAKRIYCECIESGSWPGYSIAEPLGLPTYAEYQMDDLLGLSAGLGITF